MIMVEKAIVHRDKSITFKFYNGNEITIAANLVASIVEEELDGVGVLLGVLTLLLIGVVLEEIGVLEDDELLLEDGSLLF